MARSDIFTHGYVVGVLVISRGDSDDAGRLPDAVASKTRPVFTRIKEQSKLPFPEPEAGAHGAFVSHERITTAVIQSGEHVGQLTSDVTADGNAKPDAIPGVELVVGAYQVNLGAGFPAAFDIEVTAEHTQANPLDLYGAAPYVPPAGSTVTTVLLPAGAAIGQVLGFTAEGWQPVDQSGGGGGTSTLNDLTDVDTTGQTTGDVLKYNGTSWVADAVSAGTVTSTSISDSTATGRAVLTAADAATARTEIGAGTSNLAIGTTGTTAAAGNRAASTTAIGMVELATNTETTTGTDTARAVTPAGVKAVVDALSIPNSPDDIGAAPATQAINAKTGAYTLIASDAGKLVTLTLVAPADLTVPANVFTAGQRVDIADRGTARVTVVAGSGMTVNPPAGGSLVMEGRYAYASLVFVSATEADLVGLVAAS